MPSLSPLARIHSFTLGPYETNCYVVSTAAGDAWIVDASFDPDPIIEHVRAEGLRVRAIVLTHAHIDHIAGVADVVRALRAPDAPPLPVWIHEAERDWLHDPMLNLSAFSGMEVTAPGPDRLLKHGETLELGGTQWQVRHTPGHSPGGITLYCAALRTALVGDALFAGSVGRTDFPGCSMEQLSRSIRTQLYTLPDDTRVLPGHGPETTIGREKRGNPFVRA